MSKDSKRFPIDKKYKKKDLLFEYVSIGVLGVLFLLLVITAIVHRPTYNKTEIIIISVSALLSLYALLYQIHKAIKDSKVVVKVHLSVKVMGKDAFISCAINNVGTKTLYPFLTNLYITESIPERKGNIVLYKFEPITQHSLSKKEKEKKEGKVCNDCIISMRCKADKKRFFPDEEDPPVTFPKCRNPEFLHTLRFCCNLKLLSYVSLLFVMPKETFKEDTIISFDKPGYYRAIAIYTDKDWDECTCSSAVFKIE